MSFEDLDLLPQLPKELQKLFSAMPLQVEDIFAKFLVSTSGRLPKLVSMQKRDSLWPK